LVWEKDGAPFDVYYHTSRRIQLTLHEAFEKS